MSAHYAKKNAMRGRNSTHIRINVGFFIYICTLNNIIFNYYGT